MDPRTPPDWAAELAAAAAWWREAGVEHAFEDAPRNWLGDDRRAVPAEHPTPRSEPSPSAAPAPPAPGVRRHSPPPPPAIGGERSRWPTRLGEFADWWLTEPSLDPVPGARRVAPAGPAAAPLMVLVPQPEADDRETLLGGPQGRLLEAMFAAFGLERSRVYLASVLPRFTPVADWAGLAANGMREVLAHHVALAAPARLLAFDRSLSSLLGHDPAQPRADSLHFYHAGGSVPLLLAPALDSLLERPERKRGVWMRWLDWTGGG